MFTRFSGLRCCGSNWAAGVLHFPSLFSFSFPDCVKTPLCSEDVDTFLSSNPSEQVLISISHYPFVTNFSEGQQHLQHSQRVTKALTFADTILNRAQENAEQVTDSLESLKKATLDMVGEQFDQMTVKLLEFHTGLERALQEGKESLEHARVDKDMLLEGVAQALVNYADFDKGNGVYEGCLRDCTVDVKRSVLRSLRFPVENPGAYLELALRGEEIRPADATSAGGKANFPQVKGPFDLTTISSAVRAQNPYKQNGPTRGYPVPDPYKPPKSLTPQTLSSYQPGFKCCELCRTALSASNSIIAPSHENCFFCFGCLKEFTHTYIRCPVCKTGFSTVIRKSLEDRIPGLIKVQSKKRLRRLGVNLNMSCCECNSRDLFHAHKCPNGDLICLTCCQCSIIINPQAKPGRCPRCGMGFSGDVYVRFNGKQHQCEGCGSGLVLEETVEYVRDRQGIRYFCVTCREGRTAPEYPME